MNDRVHGIMCYWSFVLTKTKFQEDNTWKLEESFPIDDNGYPMADVSTGGGDRHEFFKWLNKTVYHLEDKWVTEDEVKDIDLDDLDDDNRPIMGRAVTLWTMSGVQLMGLNPPDWCPWLGIDVTEKIKNSPRWYEFIADGGKLYLGTLKEAGKFVSINKQKTEK